MYIIKIGGGEAINLPRIIADLAELNEQIIIVHGANALRDATARQLGMEKKTLTSVSGYTSVYSDAPAIDIILMTYAGLRNKRIVELCQQNGINAIGLSGIDGKIIQGERNRGIRVYEDGKKFIKRDFSGKPKTVNTSLLKLLLDNGYTPVLSIPILDENNIAINSENDDIVSRLHKELHAQKIFQFIEAPGFLENPADPESLVSELSASELEAREQQVDGRMKRKILALRKLFESGSTEVIIADGCVEHPVQAAMAGRGTIITES
ncbi:MAG: [LysW]-aminoadipate kinase [Gammaproteobacteria bacterium]|nr:[LysW]-aminoadipate kinase [Gammaproteobacteria bacterium]